MRKNECFFCTDCDAVKCPERLLQHLRRIAEQAGKEQYSNAVHLCGELVQDCMRELRVVLNRPRPGASACSPASPAPSSVGPSARGGESPSSASSPSSGAAGVTASSDPSAAIRADPSRPAWLTEEMLPLPAGTERVLHGATYPNSGTRCFPHPHYWHRHDGVWDTSPFIHGEDECLRDGHEVYRVPPPQPEKSAALESKAPDLG